MISYQFKCQDCRTEFSEMRTMEDRKRDGVCPNCSGLARFIITTSHLKADISSDKWVKNREQVMKREQKCLKDHGTYR